MKAQKRKFAHLYPIPQYKFQPICAVVLLEEPDTKTQVVE